MSKNALVCALMPESDRDSGSRRLFDLITFLQDSGYAVTFVSQHANPSARHARVLQRRGVIVYAGASAWMDPLIATRAFELVLFGLWYIAEPYLPSIRERSPSTRIIVDSVDLHFLRLSREIFSATASTGVSGQLDSGYADQMRREINTYAAADAVLTVSPKEADLINDLVSDATLAHSVPDNEELSVSPISFKERSGIVFVGCFRHKPNIGAVEHLCRDILPRMEPTLLAEHPVYIVGDGLNDTVRSFGRELPQVRMVGWVPSVVPYFERARVSAIPLLYGAGTKRKLLQALMIGTPTVSTSIGAEGFNLRHEEHVLIAHDAAEFACSLSQLLTDEVLWNRMAEQGRTHLASTHSREVAQNQLSKVIAGVRSRRTKTLLHHDVRSAGRREVTSHQEYQRQVARIRDEVAPKLPGDATVVVVSKGDSDLLRLGSLRGWHFPQDDRGNYPGYYPATGSEVVAQLAALRDRGGDFLLIPQTAIWWLEHYSELKDFLEAQGQEVLRLDDTCTVYSLRKVVVQSWSSQHFDPQSPEVASPKVVWGDSGSRLLPVPMHSPGNAADENFTGPDGRDAAADVRLIAFYLPQFHPIPENDEWWGTGFTEWRNVTKAKPLFSGHQQPHLPADLGFYDLRAVETRRAQASLAREYGIHGFCYYHYWFNGKRLLERPFEEVLRSGDPDLPFCLCWANEPWSRRWDGMEHEVLQPQSYGEEDDLNHIHWLLPALSDPRAIRIEGSPVFIVYQGHRLPEPQRTIDVWRREVEKAGLPGIYLIAVETGWDAGWDATEVGFDAKLLFQPQFSILRSAVRIEIPGKPKLQVYDYESAWPVLASPEPVGYRRYESVFPSWDNTARQGENGTVIHGSTPEAYEQWLTHSIRRAQAEPAEHRIVFVNAWNEWAEGAHLEPDTESGRSYLEATRRALAAFRTPSLIHRAATPCR